MTGSRDAVTSALLYRATGDGAYLAQVVAAIDGGSVVFGFEPFEQLVGYGDSARKTPNLRTS